MTTEAPRPFTVQVPNDGLVDLRGRLKRVRWEVIAQGPRRSSLSES